jgi:hypothetical protein
MATFGDALAALETFRTGLVDEQMNAAIPEAHALAFRPAAGAVGDSVLRNVHATGVGVRGNVDNPVHATSSSRFTYSIKKTCGTPWRNLS